MRIIDHLALPEDTSLDAFITRLDDTEDRVRTSLRTFVVTERVREDLDTMLGAIGDRLSSGKDVGRFIYGSFGSGKSHLLTVLGRMLASDEAVYDLGHKHLRWLRGRHTWLDKRTTLVVRLNMMEKRGLVTALYEAYNEALPAGVPRLSFTDDQRVFDRIEADAARFGGLDALLQTAWDEGAFATPVGMPPMPTAAHAKKWYADKRHGNLDERLALAAALLTWRDHGEEPVRPDDLWVDAQKGFDRLARHAQEHGFQQIAWLIDELVIWIRGRDRTSYIKQINDLSALVDHDTARALPFFVAVAVQMDIAETCPEDISEQDFRDQLGFISNRFQPALHLEEQDLFEVCTERVLGRKPDLDPAERKAFEGAIDQVFTQHGDTIRALSGELDPHLVRRLYPFHPALLRVLVDVTQGLSRSRTSMAVLYGLLRARPEMEVGAFVPLGGLWDILFTADNVQALQQNRRSALAQRMADAAETWDRLRGKVDSVTQDTDARDGELAQLVRSVLLCQLSEKPHFPDGRALKEAITASMLLNLNRSDVKALTERTGISKVARLFRTLQGVAPQVHVAGDPADPLLEIKTTTVDIEKVLAEARAKVGHPQRFAYARALLAEQLDLPIGTGTEGRHKLLWRGTNRSGEVRVTNVRTLSYAGQKNDFSEGEHDFLLLVDYPFDDTSGCSRQDDVNTAQNARIKKTHWSVAWLPEHFSATERASLDNAAAVELIRQDKRTYLQNYSPREANEIARALEAFQAGRKAELEEAIRRLYFDAGEVHTLKSVLDGVSLVGADKRRALEHLATHVLDKRYPNHPTFTRRVGKPELDQIAEWVVRAAQTGEAVGLTGSQMQLVDAVAVPLELVYKGTSTITPRRDGRYLASILEWVGDRRGFDGQALRTLLMAEDGWGYGFTRELADFFLFYLLQVEGFEARVDGQSTTIVGPTELPNRITLVKDEVVDAPTWDQARSAADKQLDVRGRADLPTSPEQAKLVKDARAAAIALRKPVSTFRTHLVDVCTWADVLPTDSARTATVSSLQAWLDGLLAETTNVGFTRHLAAWHGHAPKSRWLTTRSFLGKEVEAIARIADRAFMFQQVEARADDAAKQQVILRLRNLLMDDIDTSKLHEQAEAWTRACEAHFKRLYPPTTTKGGKTATASFSTARGDALTTTAEQLQQLLAQVEGDKLTVRITVEPRT